MGVIRSISGHKFISIRWFTIGAPFEVIRPINQWMVVNNKWVKYQQGR